MYKFNALLGNNTSLYSVDGITIRMNCVIYQKTLTVPQYLCIGCIIYGVFQKQ